jgi:hypothetical protein
MSPSVLRTVTIDGEPLKPRARGRRSDAEIGRDRKYLTPAEVELLVATAKKHSGGDVVDGEAIDRLARLWLSSRAELNNHRQQNHRSEQNGRLTEIDPYSPYSLYEWCVD